MGERAYLPALGRFTSLDPAFGGGINAYSYANNDPINNNDPNGTLSTTVVQSAGGGGTGIVGALWYGAKATQASTTLIAPNAFASVPTAAVPSYNLADVEPAFDVLDVEEGTEAFELFEDYFTIAEIFVL